MTVIHLHSPRLRVRALVRNARYIVELGISSSSSRKVALLPSSHEPFQTEVQSKESLKTINERKFQLFPLPKLLICRYAKRASSNANYVISANPSCLLSLSSPHQPRLHSLVLVDPTDVYVMTMEVAVLSPHLWDSRTQEVLRL